MKTISKLLAFYGIGIIAVLEIILFIAVYNLIFYDFVYWPPFEDGLKSCLIFGAILGFAIAVSFESLKEKIFKNVQPNK